MRRKVLRRNGGANCGSAACRHPPLVSRAIRVGARAVTTTIANGWAEDGSVISTLTVKAMSGRLARTASVPPVSGKDGSRVVSRYPQPASTPSPTISAPVQPQPSVREVVALGSANDCVRPSAPAGAGCPPPRDEHRVRRAVQTCVLLRAPPRPVRESGPKCRTRRLSRLPVSMARKAQPVECATFSRNREEPAIRTLANSSRFPRLGVTREEAHAGRLLHLS